MGSFKGYGRPMSVAAPEARRTGNGMRAYGSSFSRNAEVSWGWPDDSPIAVDSDEPTNLFNTQDGPMANMGLAAHRHLPIVRAERREHGRSLRASTRR